MKILIWLGSLVCSLLGRHFVKVRFVEVHTYTDHAHHLHRQGYVFGKCRLCSKAFDREPAERVEA